MTNPKRVSKCLQNKTYTVQNPGDLLVYLQHPQQVELLLNNPPTAITINKRDYTVTYELEQSSNPLRNEKETLSFYSEKDLGLIKVVVTVTSPNGKTKGSSEGYVVIE